MTRETSKLRFAHFSDAHIGHRQYGVKKRRDDMYMTFKSTILNFIDEQIDFAIFSGDLFHNKDVNAQTLRDSEKGLKLLNKENIPIVGIQGNHDAKLYKEDLNWMEYLHDRKRIILLKANIQGNGITFDKHDPNNPGTSSGYIDIKDTRIFGLQYLGQRTKDYLEDVTQAIKEVNKKEGEPKMTILLGHFGIEKHIPGISGGISYNNLKKLKEVVDYLGLGHLHKQYSHAGWVFSPGSLEAHDTREAKWNHGYYLIKTQEDGYEYEYNHSKRRPFFKVEFTVDNCNTPIEFKNKFKQEIDDSLPKLQEKQQKEKYMAKGNTRYPVIDLRLNGLLQFSRSQLGIDWIRKFIEKKINALYVNISDATESKETTSILQDLDEGEEELRDEDGQINREKLEVAVFKKLASQDSRFQEKEEEVAKTLKVVKSSILSDESFDSVAETVKNRRREIFPDKGVESE